MLTQTLRYSHCGSDNLVSNGHAKNGRLRFRCKDCKKYGRQNPGSNAYDDKTGGRGTRMGEAHAWVKRTGGGGIWGGLAPPPTGRLASAPPRPAVHGGVFTEQPAQFA